MNAKMALKKIAGKNVYNKIRYLYYKYVEWITYLGHRNTYSCKRKGDSLVVVFIVATPQSWNSLKTVYEAAIENIDVKVYIVVLPKETIKSNGDIINSYDFFTAECKTIIRAIEEGILFDIKTLKPDVVFRETPYDQMYPKQYSYRNISKYAKVCYVPYNYNYSPLKHLNIEYNPLALSGLYIIFSESLSNKRFCDDKIKKHKCYENLKTFYLGFPRFDLITESDKQITPKSSKDFLWIPRWSTDSAFNDATGFFDYNEKLINYFAHNDKLSLIIRPHPLMFDNFIKEGLITKQQVNDFMMKVSKIPNIKMDDNFNYLDTFKVVDALIADMSSINVEFFLTGKPVIYCGDRNEFNKETQNMMNSFYKISDWNALKKHLFMLSEGDDKLFYDRQRAIKEFESGIKRNAGRAIIEKCLEVV